MQRFTKWKITLETAMLVLGILALKILFQHYEFEFINLNTLSSSIIAGGVFIIGMILAGTLSDFKECEKIPAEMIGALENIYEEGRLVAARWPAFDFPRFKQRLRELVDGFNGDLSNDSTEQCLAAVNRLGDSFVEMEELGLAPNYVVRLKTEQGNLRKAVLRVYQIQRTNFVPSAYILVDAMITLIIVLLLVSKIMPFRDALFQLGFLSFLFIYLIKLLRTIDKPFRVTEQTMDDVSCFLLKEFVTRIDDEASAEATTVAVGTVSK